MTHASPEMQILLIQIPYRCRPVGESCLAPTADWYAFAIANHGTGIAFVFVLEYGQNSQT